MAARAHAVVRSPIAQVAHGLVLPLVLVLLVAVIAPARPATAGERGAVAAEYEGVLDNGATWRAVVPDDWNGTLLLYSHGYVPAFVPIPNEPRIAPDPATQAALLARQAGLPSVP